MTAHRPEIQRVLVRLKGWIRRYVLVEGIAATVALACLLFWLTFGLDLAYFRFNQLELPHWFRSLCTVLMGMLVVGVAITWIGFRLMRRIQYKDLALALERKFPELNDRLITAVQFADRNASGLQSEMIERTTNEAVSRLSELQIRQTINPVPLKRMLGVAGVLLASVLVFGIANAQGMERWYQAYILGRDDYWEPFRRNDLKIHVLAGPTERVREFDAHGVYKHPRGADLQILATVPNEAVPPDRVRLQSLVFTSSGARRSQLSMSRVGDSEFRHTFARVVNDQQMWFRGGDFVNRSPFRIQVVDPPRINAISLHCDYPSYTGMDGLEDRDIRVAGMQVALPMETRFDLLATANKPLLKAKIRTPNWELLFGYEVDGKAIPTRLTLLNADTSSAQAFDWNLPPETFFDADRMQFHLPLNVTAKVQERLATLKDKPELPLPVAADETLQINLQDQDEIDSPESSTITINGIVDQPPIVETRRTGVGTVVTRMASIPIEGKITDDYGVTKAWFLYRTNDKLDEQHLPLVQGPEGQKEFRLQANASQAVERFNLIPLKLQDGQILTLSIYAEDGDNLNGPHVAHGEMFTFQIVSKDDLLAKMFEREVSLRARFEQIRSEVADLRKTFQGTQNQIGALEKLPSPPSTDVQVVMGYVDRAMYQVRKNHTESRSIELSFKELRDEMVNNRIDTAELLERIERRIIEPMSLLNNADFIDVDRRLGVLRLAVERHGAMEVSAEETITSIDRLIQQMDAILAEMQDRGTINDLIQSLSEIIQREKKLLEQIEEKRIEDSFFSPLK